MGALLRLAGPAVLSLPDSELYARDGAIEAVALVGAFALGLLITVAV